MKRIALLTATLGFPFTVMGAWFGAQFSADMVSYDPQWRQWEAVGKLYVGKDKMRMDTEEGDRTMVTVYDGTTGTMDSVNPSERTYAEMPVPGESGIPLLAVVSMPGEAGSSCQQAKISCKRLGDEQVNGVNAQKWEIVDERDPLATLRFYEWLDPKRKMVVRALAPNNSVIERKYLGEASIGGRKVEKWEVTTRQGGQTQTSIDYIDPKLEALVRQEMEGQIQALSDIEERPQPDRLFEIPADFRKLTSEEAQSGGGQRP
jgi:hypothetical protein